MMFHDGTGGGSQGGLGCLLDGLSGGTPRSHIIFPDPHLNSPIVPEFRDSILIHCGLHQHVQTLSPKVKGCSNSKRSERVSKELRRVLEVNRQVLGEPCDSFLPPQKTYGFVYQHQTDLDTPSLRRFRDSLNVSSKHMNRQLADLDPILSHLYRGAPESLKRVLEKTDRLKGSVYCQSHDEYLRRWSTIQALVDRLRLDKKEKSRSCPVEATVLNTPDLQFFLLEECVMVISPKSSWWTLYCYEEVLMLADVLISRANAILYLHLGGLECPTSRLPDTQKVVELYTFIDGLFEQWGQVVFSLVKMIEPLCVGLLLLHSPAVDYRAHFYIEQYSSLLDTLMEKGVPGLQAKEMGRRFIQLLVQAGPTPNHLSELHGLFRHWGHNTILIPDACASLMKHACHQKVLKLDNITRIHCTWVYLFFKHHYTKHSNTWPPCDIKPYLSPNLYRHRMQSTFPTGKEQLSYIYEWSFVEPGILYSIDCIEDPAIFIKDKSISPNRSHWDSVFSPDMLGYSPPFNTESRRLADRFINDPDFSPYRVIEYIESGEVYQNEEFCINLSMKERELSTGRAFGKLPYLEREAQALGEYLLSEGPAKAFESNTKSLDEIKLMKELAEQSSLHSDEGDITVTRGTPLSATMVTDYMKFCANFRHETCLLIERFCAKTYGLRDFFSWHHRRISDGFIYVADYHHPPSEVTQHNRSAPPPSDCLWYNHLGGIEGYKQTVWTMFCCALTHLVSLELDIPYTAMIQGDNQIISAVVRAKEGELLEDLRIRAVGTVQTFGNRMSQIALGAGLTLKPEETFIHTACMVYSKRILHHGVDLTQATKIVCRAMPNSSAVFDDPDLQLSSISSCGSRSVARGVPIITPYLVAEHQSALAYRLSEHFHIGVPKGLARELQTTVSSEEELYLILNVGTALGGPSANSLLRYLVRHEPDPVTTGFYWLMLKAEANPIFFLVASGVMNKVTPSRDLLSLVKDSRAISLPVCRTVSSAVKAAVQEGLTTGAVNPMLRGLFHEHTDEEDLAYGIFLLSTTPCIPLVSSELYHSSTPGVREKLIGYVDSTKTSLASSLTRGFGGSMHETLQGILLLRYRYQRELASTLPQAANPMLRNCTLAIADHLRVTSWRHTLDTIGAGPLEGMSEPCVFEQTTLTEVRSENCTLCECGRQEHLLFRVAERDGQEPICFKRGLLPPYVGSETSEKLAPPLLKLRSMSAPLKSAVRICSILKWVCEPDPTCDEALRWLSSQRVNAEPEDLELLTPVSTRSNVLHRLKDSFGKHNFATNRPLNVSSQVHISTNKMGKYSGSGGGTDCNLIFQNAKHAGLSLIDLAWGDSAAIPIVNFHLHANGCCVRETPAVFIKTFNTKPPPIERIEGNPMVYDDSPLGDGGAEDMMSAEVIRRKKKGSPNSHEGITETCTWALSQHYYSRFKMWEEKSKGADRQMMITEEAGMNVTECIHLGCGRVFKLFCLQLLMDKVQHFILPLLIDGGGASEIMRSYWTVLPQDTLRNFDVLLTMGPIRSEVVDYCKQKGYQFRRDWSTRADFSELMRFYLMYTCEDILNPDDPFLSSMTHVHVFRKEKMFDWSANSLLQMICLSDIRRYAPEVAPEDWLSLIIALQRGPSHMGQFGRSSLLAVIDEMSRGESKRCLTMKVGSLLSARVQLLNVSKWECDPAAWAREGVRDLKDRFKEEKNDQETPIQKITMRINAGDLAHPQHALCKHGPGGSIVLNCSTINNLISISETSVLPTPKHTSQSLREVFVGRTTGIATSAHYKLLEMLKYVNIPAGSNVLCLAEGSGGFAKTLLQTGKVHKLYFNTLVQWGKATPHYTGESIGSELRDSSTGGLPDSVRMLTREINDLRDQRILDVFSGCKTRFEVITCDAEYYIKNPSKDANLPKIVALVAAEHLTKEGCLIWKAFCDDNPTMRFCEWFLTSLFEEVRVVKPIFSSPDSSEVYWVCQKKKTCVSDLNALVKSTLDEPRYLCRDTLSSSFTNDLRVIRTESAKRLHRVIGDYTLRTELHRSLCYLGWEENFNQSRCALGLTNPFDGVDNDMDAMLD
ncbi:L protein, partial [Oberland virus]